LLHLSRVFIAGPLLDESAPQVRIVSEALVALRRREMAHRRPRGMRGEGVSGRFQPPGEADGPASDLAIDCQAGSTRRMDLRPCLAPELGCVVDLQQQHGEWPPRNFGGGTQRLELARAEIGVDLDHAASGAPHRACQS